MRRLASVVALALLICGCSKSSSRLAEGSPDEVRAAIESSSQQLTFADQVMGAGHSTDRQGEDIVWHFTMEAADYGRYRISLSPSGEKTRVDARFEPVNDASSPAIPFLRDSAKAVSEELVSAAIENRAVDQEALKRKYLANTARNPMAVVGVQQQQYWDDAQNTLQ